MQNGSEPCACQQLPRQHGGSDQQGRDVLSLYHYHQPSLPEALIASRGTTRASIGRAYSVVVWRGLIKLVQYLFSSCSLAQHPVSGAQSTMEHCS